MPFFFRHQKKRAKRATRQEQTRDNTAAEDLEAPCPGAGLSPQVPSQPFGPVLPATAGEAPCGGYRPPLAAPRTSPESKLGTRAMMNTVDHVPTYFGTGVHVRGASPGRLINLERHKFFRMHTYEKSACKFFGIHCYKIIGLKAPWNEYLRKNRGWGGP